MLTWDKLRQILRRSRSQLSKCTFFSFSARLSCYAGKLYWKKILLLQKMWFVDSFCHQNKSFSFCMIFLLSQSNFLKVSKKIWANQIIKFYDDRILRKSKLAFFLSTKKTMNTVVDNHFLFVSVCWRQTENPTFTLFMVSLSAVCCLGVQTHWH